MWFALATVSCASTDAEPPHGLARLWRQFLEMPEERAIALAGDPEKRWVVGVSSGQASLEAAEELALAKCMEQRAQQRMQDPCRLYAAGDEIVWRSR